MLRLFSEHMLVFNGGLLDKGEGIPEIDMCTFTTIANMTAASVRRNGVMQYK